MLSCVSRKPQLPHRRYLPPGPSRPIKAPVRIIPLLCSFREISPALPLRSQLPIELLERLVSRFKSTADAGRNRIVVRYLTQFREQFRSASRAARLPKFVRNLAHASQFRLMPTMVALTLQFMMMCSLAELVDWLELCCCPEVLVGHYSPASARL